MNAMRSRWALFMLAWILKTKAEKKSSSMASIGADRCCARGRGGGGHAQEVLQERLHAEGRQRGAEEHRGELAVADAVAGRSRRQAPSSSSIVLDELVRAWSGPACRSSAGSSSIDLRWCRTFLALVLEEKCKISCLFPVVHAQKLLAGADGPVDGVGVDAQLLLHLLAQLEGVSGFPVHLVDEGKDGDVPHGADLEQLPGLGLDALGRVDDHHGASRRP